MVETVTASVRWHCELYNTELHERIGHLCQAFSHQQTIVSVPGESLRKEFVRQPVQETRLWCWKKPCQA